MYMCYITHNITLDYAIVRKKTKNLMWFKSEMSNYLYSRDIVSILNGCFDLLPRFPSVLDYARKHSGIFRKETDPLEILIDFCVWRAANNFDKKEKELY